MLIISCIFLFVQLHSVYCARILFIPAHNMASHTKSTYPFAELLASKNHEVYVLQILRDNHEKTKSKVITDLYLNASTKGVKNVDQALDPAMLWGTLLNQPFAIAFPQYAASTVCRDVLNNEETLEEYLKIVQKQKWDLIFVDTIFSPCGVIATRISESPWMDFSTSLIISTTFNFKGLPLKPSTVPSLRPDGKFESKRFHDRFWSGFDYFIFDSVVQILDYLTPYWVNSPLSKYFDLTIFHSRSILAFGSMPFELDFIHAKSTSTIEMDGSCPKSRPLPDSYSSFVDDPTSKGTILFAMGHFGDWEYAPPTALQSFVDAFNELTEYRIVWQFVGKGRKPEVKKHIRLDSWLPQTELLYHNKTRLFVSHVGLKSFLEAVCTKVPIVALPMFAEQLRNAAQVKHKGVGEVINKLHITKEEVLAKIRKVLDDQSYKTNAVKLQDSLSDRIANPLEIGAFWTNFVLKHKSYVSRFLDQKISCTFSIQIILATISLSILSIKLLF